MYTSLFDELIGRNRQCHMQTPRVRVRTHTHTQPTNTHTMPIHHTRTAYKQNILGLRPTAQFGERDIATI